MFQHFINGRKINLVLSYYCLAYVVNLSKSCYFLLFIIQKITVIVSINRY